MIGLWKKNLADPQLNIRFHEKKTLEKNRNFLYWRVVLVRLLMLGVQMLIPRLKVVPRSPRIIPGFDNSFLCKWTRMGLNEELNETLPTNEWSFSTWQWHSKRLGHGGKDLFGLDRAHIRILCGNQPLIKFGTEILCALRFETV